MKIILMTLLLCSGWTQAALRPADGLWRPSDDPRVGSGLVLVTQGSITLVSVFTYNESGTSVWFVAAGVVDDDGLFSAPLAGTSGGTYLTDDEPVTADFMDESRQLEIQFDSTHTATFSIAGSPPKSIQPMTFGRGAFATEHLQLQDGTSFLLSDLSGTWAVGSQASTNSFFLDLAPVSEPGTDDLRQYRSQASLTDGWQINCPELLQTGDVMQDHCVLQGDEQVYHVPLADLGHNHMRIESVDGQQQLTGHRVDFSGVIKPASGHWRTTDDPAVGSGVVMHTQHEMTLVLVYTYDDQGQAIWQVASGRFDASGLMRAPLLNASNGSPIEAIDKQNGEYAETTHELEIQLVGAQQATLRIDGSAVKDLKMEDFGVAQLSIEVPSLFGERYELPSPVGRWMYVNHRAPVIKPINSDLFINPDNEFGFNAEFDLEPNPRNSYGLIFDCLLIVNLELQPYCSGYLLGTDASSSMHVRFEHLGYQRILVYIADKPYPGNDTIQAEFIRLD